MTLTEQQALISRAIEAIDSGAVPQGNTRIGRSLRKSLGYAQVDHEIEGCPCGPDEECTAVGLARSVLGE